MKEQKQSESEILAKQLNDEFGEIIECSFDGILVSDGDGNVLFVNSAYEKHTGILQREIIGRNIRDFVNPVWMKTSVILLVLEQRGAVSMSHNTKNDKHIIVTGTPLFGDDGQIARVVVNSRDISEIYHLKNELLKTREKADLYDKLIKDEAMDDNDVVITNPHMQEIYQLTERICNFNTSVLITGESGVGKELVARSLHEKSELKKDKRFIVVNCGAIPENLLESELFGYAEGSFTGAAKGGKEGLFEAANGGTIFLDEIGDLSTKLQVKLLRALETRTITRVGSAKEIPLNINVVAATNKNLKEAVEAGTFREDLYYRLNVISIDIPPLRKRKDEIAPLALKFVKKFNREYGLNKTIEYEVIRELEDYEWPGNIRQLKNIIENMMIMSQDESIMIYDIPWIRQRKRAGDSQESAGKVMSLQEKMEEYERNLLRGAKEKYKTTRKIAEALGVDHSTIARKLKKYNL